MRVLIMLALIAVIGSFPRFAAAAASHDAIHMLVPGFAVRELPVRLSNVNTLRFGPDGRLYALGYDGRVHALRDTDGDGLEDEARPYWDRPTLRVPVGMAWGSDGLFISSQGKVSLLRDTDRDGRADAEQVLASGWPKTDVASGGVDATSLVIAPQGDVYFGLLTANYSNPYRIKDGESRYDLRSERGTIQRMAADGSNRRTFSTGIRVPYAMAFNREGDLFVTDQEGETWLPGGNPLDELNHVLPDKHYGFPPRHEEHLPGVADEPPVVGFGPQHQSTCGLVFNEVSERQKLFGPATWEGNALVAGFSRGKIWRVALVKTPAGYVGKETLIASADLMVADLAISADGNLYVACHSGQPDWGTGPKGAGTLFKISYTDPTAPQPVAAWPAGPEQVSIAFDRPIRRDANGSGAAAVEYGPFVRAADRFEVLRPGYQSVKQQQAAPRHTLDVRSRQVSADGRTLLLTTAPHPRPVHYAVSAPLAARAGSETVIDLAYDLSGAEAKWAKRGFEREAEPAAWLPHVATDVSLALLAGSAEAHRLTEQLRTPGTLTIRTLLDLPPGRFVLRLDGNAPFSAATARQPARTATDDGGSGSHLLELKVSGGARVPLSVELTTGTAAAGAPPRLHVAYASDADPTPRPLPLQRLLVPWAPAPAPPPVAPAPVDPTFAGGDAERGRVLFTDQLKCVACHRPPDAGGESAPVAARDLGPVLTNLAHRDPAAVLRDVTEPSATLNPDYVSYHLKLRDGRRLSGFVRPDGNDAVRVVATDHDTRIAREQIREMRPSGLSAMPEGLLTRLEPEQVADLLAYLMSDAAAPPAAPTPSATTRPAGPATRPAAAKAKPPVRTRAEIRAVLGEAPPPPPRGPAGLRPLRVTLVAGPKDHGPGEHDYPAWQKDWEKLLKGADALAVSTAWQWPTAEQFAAADVLMFYCWNHAWTPERYRELDAYLARGGGVVLLHAACIADRDPEALAERMGLAAQPKRTKYRHGPLELKAVAGAEHPITRGFSSAHFVDETYWPMIGDPRRVTVLATAEEEGKARPMFWTFEKGRGRVFGSVLGHYAWTFDDPLFRALVLRGTMWAAREDERRLEPLATAGLKLPE